MADTANLIAQARDWTNPMQANLSPALTDLLNALADALEAAEDERDRWRHAYTLVYPARMT